MKPIARAYWPIKLFDYVRGVGPIARNSGNIISTMTDKDLIEVDNHDLQFCAPVKPVSSYWTLVTLTSKIAAANPGYMLCYRGQQNDFHLGNQIGHVLCPTLWRTNPEADFDTKCATLLSKDQQFMQSYKSYEKADSRIVELMKETPLARWALLQHYGVCDTPLLDLTRSLQVACSFASGGDDGVGYVYVLGLPYQNQAITTDTESDITCMSLLGVTPSNARRPLVQEGYLACDGNWWRVYSRADRYSGDRDVDFSSRLLAVIQVYLGGSFWESCPNEALTDDLLMPEDDPFMDFLQSYNLVP